MTLKLCPNQRQHQTDQYIQAIQLAADGHRADEAAAIMFRSGYTLDNWYTKLQELNGYSSKTQLIAEALRNGIIH